MRINDFLNSDTESLGLKFVSFCEERTELLKLILLVTSTVVIPNAWHEDVF